MQILLVGGAIRDALLGQPVVDQDYVVVGATPEQMIAKGFRAVGKDFPVFLHPITQQEYALARTERKTARGYQGFQIHADPSVTLEQDLQRRDLTINAMARDEQGVLHDPFGGQADLKARVFKHVSPAFAEDPVRILRVARFAARFPDFTVAPETLELMRQMVQSGEVDALVAERVWQEMSRGLMQVKPSRMFEVLKDCGALQRIFPELDCLWGVPQPEQHHPEIDTGVHAMMVLDTVVNLQGADLAVRYAALTHDLGKGTTPVETLPRHLGHEQRSMDLIEVVSQRWRVPAECHDLAVMVAREHGAIHRIADAGAAAIVRLLERCDGMRKPQRFAQCLTACEADHRGRLGLQDRAYPQREFLLSCLSTVKAVNAGVIANEVTERLKVRAAQAVLDNDQSYKPNVPVPEAIKAALHQERIRALKLIVKHE
jgi:tRNA nucleotidyltransferase (CCA-adding enzyme)